MKILAVKKDGRTGDDTDFRELDLIKEINCINLFQRTKNSTKVLAFHTDAGIYFPLTTLADISKVCEKYGFEMMGDAAVNTSRVEEIKTVNNNGSIVTFIDGNSVTVKKQV